MVPCTWRVHADSNWYSRNLRITIKWFLNKSKCAAAKISQDRTRRRLLDYRMYLCRSSCCIHLFAREKLINSRRKSRDNKVLKYRRDEGFEHRKGAFEQFTYHAPQYDILGVSWQIIVNVLFLCIIFKLFKSASSLIKSSLR